MKIKNRKTEGVLPFKNVIEKKLARDMKYVCSYVSMMINELLFREARSALGINIINFSYPNSFSLGGKSGYIRQ